MLEFGWVPKTIERLTFDQLDAILEKLEERNNRIRGKTEEIDAKKVPIAAKATGPEINSWVKAGCPPTFESYVKKLRKDENG